MTKHSIYNLKLKWVAISVMFCSILWLSSADKVDSYHGLYKSSMESFILGQETLLNEIGNTDFKSPKFKDRIKERIYLNRVLLKKVDFWLRYLEPVAYKKINGPLPVEWETEVFEKFEKPYKRLGAGLSLSELYLGKEQIYKDSLANLFSVSIEASKLFLSDSIKEVIHSHHHFFLANRLFLLNLATIYTTGFECPEKKNIIPELKAMLTQVSQIYISYNISFPEYSLKVDYLNLFADMLKFVQNQQEDFEKFNHFVFIKKHVNPLFAINQYYIQLYAIKSIGFNDYSLNNYAKSIYDKKLYEGQDVKGVYRSINEESLLNEIRSVGKLLFYDPILSGNNKRSCASCHKPKEYFTDTAIATSLQFNHVNHLDRNTPSLINVEFNHLIMLDGKHINLMNQARNVITNPIELNSEEKNLVDKVMSCREYKVKLKKIAKQSTESKVNYKHIISAIIFYYSGFSYFNSPLDDAMNNRTELDAITIQGFNLFMSKAQCATCHFAPQFNGVKPPYIGSEFEVIGVPSNLNFKNLSSDSGRYLVNPAFQTLHAFRTGTIRNALHTKPYMHNGVFNSLDEVIDFYNSGGGIGKGLKIENQSLASDSLKLSDTEKLALLKFIGSLSENIIFEDPPDSLPFSSKKELNLRKIGGEY